MGDGTALETGADLSGNRRFESISLQRRVVCEPYSSRLAPGERYYRFAGVKNRERKSRSPNTRPISLNAKYGIKPTEMIIIAKRNAFGLPSPICGKLSLIVFHLNFPITISSNISNNNNKIVNEADLTRIA